MEDDNNTFTLDDKVYNIDDVSDKAKFVVYNLNELSTKRRKIDGKLAILNAAELGFITELREEVAETEEVKEGEVV